MKIRPLETFPHQDALQYGCITAGIHKSADWDNIDLNLGWADGEKGGCIWTKDGFRIDILHIPGYGLDVSQTQDPDPDYFKIKAELLIEKKKKETRESIDDIESDLDLNFNIKGLNCEEFRLLHDILHKIYDMQSLRRGDLKCILETSHD